MINLTMKSNMNRTITQDKEKKYCQHLEAPSNYFLITTTWILSRINHESDFYDIFLLLFFIILPPIHASVSSILYSACF